MTVSQALLKKAERIQRLVQNGSVDEDPQAWMAGVHVAELAESIIPTYYPIADAATRAQVMRQAAALMYGVAETEQETLAVLLDRDADVVSDCQYILDRDQSNHLAWFMMGKAKRTLNDPLGAIADFTKAIALKED